MVVSSVKLVEVSLKLDAIAEDIEEDSAELLDDVAALLDDELVEELTADELGVLLDEELDELGVSAAALELLLPEDPPPQAVSNKKDK